MSSVKKIASRLLLFLIPIAIFISIIISLGAYTGDTLPMTAIVNRQMEDTPWIYLPNDRQFEYKFTAIQIRQPEILIFGSSRVWAFGKELISEQPNIFYNGCILGTTPNNLLELLKTLDDNYPQIIIWGIDQSWFSPSKPTAQLDSYQGASLDEYIRVGSTMANLIMSGTVSVDVLITQNYPYFDGKWIGSQTLLQKRGFVNDGTFWLLDNNLNNPDRFDGMIDMASNANGLFPPAEYVETDRLQQIEETLQFAYERNIKLIGFFPPVALPVYHTLDFEDKHQYWQEASNVISSQFSEYQMPFYDFTNPVDATLSEDHFTDGVHITHLGSAIMMRRFVEDQPNVFAPYTNISQIENIIEN